MLPCLGIYLEKFSATKGLFRQIVQALHKMHHTHSITTAPAIRNHQEMLRKKKKGILKLNYQSFQNPQNCHGLTIYP